MHTPIGTRGLRLGAPWVRSACGRRSSGRFTVLLHGILSLLVVCRPTPAAERPPEQETHGLTPILENMIDRPLRYTPQGTDFVITNGTEYFNRPLYAANAPFRIDGGDRPEFSLYLPGRGGNLRLGWIANGAAAWLDQSSNIVARYRPGSLIYDVTDSSGKHVARLTVLPLKDARGLVGRVEPGSSIQNGTEWVLAFGGVNGMRGRRSGDIGCENLPISQFFQLRPEQCRDDRITPGNGVFITHGRPGAIAGVLPLSRAVIADANHWSSLSSLLQNTNAANIENQLAVLRRNAQSQAAFHFVLRQVETNSAPRDVAQTDEASLARLFAEAEEHRKRIAERVRVETPDPFINAAAAALNIAADGVWDARQESFMHGAVAWRNRLLGWRGMYSGDALGWHERTRRHFDGFARQQNTNAIPEIIPPADASANLSRSEAALHSNGNMTRNHYDMNLVAVDAFFRHLLWTGDLEFAARMWPVIERHFAWERRLFRREFGSDRLPLYEAYAAIWASDDLAYNGGGSTHGSAYNYFHQRMAARVAARLGKDAAPFNREADLIRQAMRRELWLPERGWFAEWKDLLGLQLVHPNAAAWTFYHTIDSAVPSAEEAWQMSRFAQKEITKIPVRGPGVPEGAHTQPTTTWMPYSWSLNNVVLSEVQHTALAHWQAGRRDAAMPLFKGALLDSMFLGLCPGNVGMSTFYDAYRRESQRDFADGVGSLSRALVEGLFGVQPDLLQGEVRVRPGFPGDWQFARMDHPDFTIRFERDGTREHYVFHSRFAKPVKLRLHAPALRDQATVTCNGRQLSWKPIETAIGTPAIEIETEAGSAHAVTIDWNGGGIRHMQGPAIAALQSEYRAANGPRVISLSDPQDALHDEGFEGSTVSGRVAGTIGHRTVFALVEQGKLRWREPLEFEVRPAWEIVGSVVQRPGELRFRLRNNTPDPLSRAVSCEAGDETVRLQVPVGAFAESDEIVLSAKRLVPGANLVSVKISDSLTVSNSVVNWRLDAAADSRFEAVDLAAVFNDRVSQIFKNEYLSPRSPFCSLAVPKQGIGSWCHPADQFDIDDSGLRALAGSNEGVLRLPNGVPLRTPSQDGARNVLFTSQWDNYPSEAAVGLSGKASHAYLLMAGSSSPMQSRFDNGEVVVAYTDGSVERLPLRNPDNWWLIDQDYFIDDFAFRRDEPIPPRVVLKTGQVRVTDPVEFKGRGRTVAGGAATVLDLPLNPAKELKSLTVRALANEVVIGLMSVTLAR
ncbi:MAG TPA: DUF4450 domain-containing protein [Verrucomicrobiae bacterium]|nr:DUF4450 domain-containing protein [Verrucomicrobiae bacterium]